MTALIDVTSTQIFTCIRSFLFLVVPLSVEIVTAQSNLVPMPQGEFIVMTPLSITRLSWNRHSYTDPYPSSGDQGILTSSRHDVQLDFYGTNSQEYASSVHNLFMDQFAFENFPDNIKPLYSSGIMQIPLITGEELYETRWKLDVSLQCNSQIIIPQDFAAELKIEIQEVDNAFPPST